MGGNAASKEDFMNSQTRGDKMAKSSNYVIVPHSASCDLHVEQQLCQLQLQVQVGFNPPLNFWHP